MGSLFESGLYGYKSFSLSHSTYKYKVIYEDPYEERSEKKELTEYECIVMVLVYLIIGGEGIEVFSPLSAFVFEDEALRG